MHVGKLTDIATSVHSHLDLVGWRGSWELQGIHHLNIGAVLLFCPSAV